MHGVPGHDQGGAVVDGAIQEREQVEKDLKAAREALEDGEGYLLFYGEKTTDDDDDDDEQDESEEAGE